MEHQLWRSIVALLPSLCESRTPARFDFDDTDIVAVYYWAVLHDRPTAWACRAEHWQVGRRPGALPSPATMSRRLRSARVRRLLLALERRLTAPARPGLYWMIDGKPLPIGGCSKDRQAGYGRAAACKAKGYKIHAILNPQGEIAAWRLAPMNKDERIMAERLVKTTVLQGYLVADSNYDSNKLHEVCGRRDQLQLVTRRRYGPNHGTGHRKQTPGRIRSMQMTESPNRAFAEGLLAERGEIERHFAHLTNWGGGLSCLPAWVRTHRRVHLWVQAKLVLTALKRALKTTTYAA